MKKRFSGIYVEIGNICNLRCSFCSPTRRAPRRMSADEFLAVAEKIAPFTDRVYLHVLGEPLCHPELEEILAACRLCGLKASVTTNGTLLGAKTELLLACADVIHRVSISLHSIEANDKISSLDAVGDAVKFARLAAEAGIYTVFRLWNLDGAEREGKNSFNGQITDMLMEAFPEPWESRYSGYRLERNIFLEYASVFVWPKDSDAEPCDEGFCHALGEQIAILADGTVVPCCLDSDADMPLGNIFESSLDKILSSQRAVAMKRGFERGEFTETMCKKCTYARRFKVKGKQ